MNIDFIYSLFKQFPAIETDSRKAGQGKIFIALKGEKFNGNDFAASALSAGCPYCIVDEPVGPPGDERYILVEDTLIALQQLAKHHRQQFNIPFIAITGSNGKTTTKELVHAVLSKAFKTYTTIGNLNNHIGIPLTLLRVEADAEMAIVEMGANHQKEIAAYCEYTLPTHGLITNCGKAHLEGFGGEEGVRKGKGELFDYLRGHAGKVFVNTDYDYLHTMSAGISEIIGYGTKEGWVTGVAHEQPGMLHVDIRSGLTTNQIKTQLVGAYNLPNVLAAACVGKYFKVPEEKIVEALENYCPSNSRSQLIQMGTNDIILDAYNANPSSMQVAIENMIQQPAEKKIVMLGGMMEMGNASAQEHQRLIDLLKQHTWNKVVLVGEQFKHIPKEFLHFKDVMAAQSWFRQQHFEHCLILIKGSRSIQMEKVLE